MESNVFHRGKQKLYKVGIYYFTENELKRGSKRASEYPFLKKRTPKGTRQ